MCPKIPNNLPVPKPKPGRYYLSTKGSKTKQGFAGVVKKFP
jgi:hypothetical protein